MVNLWECLTKLGNDCDYSQYDEINEILKKDGSGFGNELSLEVNDHGTWIIKIFGTDGGNEITLSIIRNGRISVERTIDGEICDTRRITF